MASKETRRQKLVSRTKSFNSAGDGNSSTLFWASPSVHSNRSSVSSHRDHSAVSETLLDDDMSFVSASRRFESGSVNGGGEDDEDPVQSNPYTVDSAIHKLQLLKSRSSPASILLLNRIEKLVAQLQVDASTSKQQLEELQQSNLHREQKIAAEKQEHLDKVKTLTLTILDLEADKERIETELRAQVDGHDGELGSTRDALAEVQQQLEEREETLVRVREELLAVKGEKGEILRLVKALTWELGAAYGLVGLHFSGGRNSDMDRKQSALLVELERLMGQLLEYKTQLERLISEKESLHQAYSDLKNDKFDFLSTVFPWCKCTRGEEQHFPT